LQWIVTFVVYILPIYILRRKSSLSEQNLSSVYGSTSEI
jgi:hypothetical protein